MLHSGKEAAHPAILLARGISRVLHLPVHGIPDHGIPTVLTSDHGIHLDRRVAIDVSTAIMRTILTPSVV